MKIKDIKILENKMLKDIEISFENNNKILDTIVIAGANGSGKTTLLESIYYGIEDIINTKKKKAILVFEFEENEKKGLIQENGEKDFFYRLNTYSFYEKNSYEGFDAKEFYSKVKTLPKIIYIPAEIKFEDVKTLTTNLKREYKFLNIVDNTIIKDIPSYIASRITYIANTEENLTMKQAKEKVNDEINGIFNILDVDIRLKGVSKDETSTPIFINSSGEEFDINGLSSGEKQLFLRTLSIKMLAPENSIILIDEPELSLHLKWQQRIIKVYEKIGRNNQIIVATHSPHILGSVPKENIIMLSKNEVGKIIPTPVEKLENSYGQPVNRILEDLMGLETTRNIEVFNLLEEVRELVRNGKYQEEIFKEKYEKLENILGRTDTDLLLIDMEIQRKKREMKNAENR